LRFIDPPVDRPAVPCLSSPYRLHLGFRFLNFLVGVVCRFGSPLLLLDRLWKNSWTVCNQSLLVFWTATVK
jgi:hypothetical protein